MFRGFEHWMKVVLLYELVNLDLSSITGFKDIIVNYCCKFIKVMLQHVDTRNHIDFNFPYSLKGLIFSFWLQEYDTNLWEREKKDTVAEITCSHFCSNNYCLIDVDVLTKPTVLWIFIDLFNFRSLFHIIWRWYLEVYVDVRYALSLYRQF